MASHLLRTLFLLLLPSIVLGQSLNLSTTSPTGDNGTSTFLIENGEVTLRSNGIRFEKSGRTVTGFDAFGISPDRSRIAVLERMQEAGKVAVLNARGDTLHAFRTVTLGDEDPSLALFPFGNGGVMLRDNITNFTFYDAAGEILTSMSSSSQSEGGELISQVATGSDGHTVIIYNPKIKFGGKLGSKAQLKVVNDEFRQIHYSRDRYLKLLDVSDDGTMITAVTSREGTDDHLMVMDRFGNELNSITTEEALDGATLSSDNEYLSLFSGGRVMVYEALSGERLGATSLGSSVYLADYFASDNTLIVVTGDYSEASGVLNNVEFQAVNLEKRSIASREYPGSIGFSKAIKAGFERSSPGVYELIGGSKHVRIEADF